MNIRFRDPLDPPKKINLASEDAQSVEDAREELMALGLTSEGVFEIFNDWQSKRTMTAKRLFASSSVIFAAVAWIGLDMSQVSFFGIEVSQAGAIRFSVFVAAFVTVTGAIFEWSRRIDLAVKRARVQMISDSLRHGEKVVESVDKIVEKYDIDLVEKLFDDLRHQLSRDSSDIDSYNAVHFYKQYLKRAGKGLHIIERVELLGLYGIALYAISGLGRLWV